MQENGSKLEFQVGQVAWLSREIIDWSPDATERWSGDPRWEKHYEPWKHANATLVETASEQDRASAIFQLRRALEFREKALNSVYGFNRIPGGGKKRTSDWLEMFNIVLPMMRKILTDVRNDVTHDFSKPPPDVDRCRELAEFIWYFLRSTDHLLVNRISVIGFEDDTNNTGGVDLTVQPHTWEMGLSGRVNSNLLSLGETDDSFRIVFGKRVSTENHNVYFRNASLTASRNLMLDFLKVYFSVIY